MTYLEVAVINGAQLLLRRLQRSVSRPERRLQLHPRHVRKATHSLLPPDEGRACGERRPEPVVLMQEADQLALQCAHLLSQNPLPALQSQLGLFPRGRQKSEPSRVGQENAPYAPFSWQ